MGFFTGLWIGVLIGDWSITLRCGGIDSSKLLSAAILVFLIFDEPIVNAWKSEFPTQYLTFTRDGVWFTNKQSRDHGISRIRAAVLARSYQYYSSQVVDG